MLYAVCLWDLNGLDVPGRRRIEDSPRGRRDVENDTANVLDDREISRHQLALRSVRDAMVVVDVAFSRRCGRDVAKWSRCSHRFATTRFTMMIYKFQGSIYQSSVYGIDTLIFESTSCLFYQASLDCVLSSLPLCFQHSRNFSILKIYQSVIALDGGLIQSGGLRRS